jgi:hypothetical protein
MGHALEKAFQMLASHGKLVEMHFSGRRPLVEVHQADQIFVAGEVTREDDYEEHREVSAALDQVVNQGLFKPVSQRFYDYLIYAESLASLLEWRKENAKRSVIDDSVSQEVERLVSAFAGSSTVVLRQPSRLSRMSRMSRLARFDKV